MEKKYNEASEMTPEMKGKMDELKKKQAGQESDEITEALKIEAIEEDDITAEKIISPKIEKKSGSDLLDEVSKEAESEEEEFQSRETIKLRVPLNGRDEVVLDTTKITGAVLSRVQDVYAKKTKKTGRTEFIKELDPIYLTLVAVVMTEVPYKDFMEMNGADYTKICNKVRDFLLNA